MKIGILSMQRVVNYGSFLQAYALKETLKNMGHDSYFIDIQPGRKLTENNNQGKKDTKLFLYLKKMDKYIYRRIQHKFFMKKRIEKFYNEFFPKLGLSKSPSYNSNYDAVVIGSDEVFNCARNVEWGFAKTLLGEGLNSKKVITYAASCGHTTLEELEQYNIRSEVEKAMTSLDSISVRDENTKLFAKELTGKEIIENIDPTLIYDFEDKVPQSVPENNYILIYAYDNRINDLETINKIKKIAKGHNKKIISVGVYQNWVDKNILCDPFELLAYFRDADYVVTDTFHGSVFSIKYNKQFATILRESNKQKLGYLLRKFNLTGQEVRNINSLESILTQTPDFSIVNNIIKKETENALKYFYKNLENSDNRGEVLSRVGLNR